MPTWSGSFKNEQATSSPWQARNGFRIVADLTGGDMTVLAPLNPEEDSSFSVWLFNPPKNDLTIDGNGELIMDPKNWTDVTSVTSKERYVIADFSYFAGKWRISGYLEA